MATRDFTEGNTPEHGSVYSPMSLNPLVDLNGDLTPVSSALGFIAKAFEQVPDDGINLDHNDCYGLSLLIQTCAAALDQMSSRSPGNCAN